MSHSKQLRLEAVSREIFEFQTLSKAPTLHEILQFVQLETSLVVSLIYHVVLIPTNAQ